MKIYPLGIIVATVVLAALFLMANARDPFINRGLLIGAVVVLLCLEFVVAYRATRRGH